MSQNKNSQKDIGDEKKFLSVTVWSDGRAGMFYSELEQMAGFRRNTGGSVGKRLNSSH